MISWKKKKEEKIKACYPVVFLSVIVKNASLWISKKRSLPQLVKNW